MFRWFTNFLFGRSRQIDLDLAEGRIVPVDIRPYEAKDFETCRELYILNEPGRFPPNGLPHFEEALKSTNHLFLVMEQDGRICGCGGFSVTRDPSCYRAHLVYGLIHPSFQSQGLGTTLLLARLGLLPEDVQIVSLSLLPASRGFYERFNFRQVGKYKSSTWEDLPLHAATCSPDLLSQAQSLLGREGIDLAYVSSSVPITVPKNA